MSSFNPSHQLRVTQPLLSPHPESGSKSQKKVNLMGLDMNSLLIETQYNTTNDICNKSERKE